MRLPLLIGLLILGGLIVAASVYSMSRNLHVHQVSQVHQVSHVHRNANSGTIHGQVLDMAGQPISGAEVLAFKTESAMGKVPMAYTDEGVGLHGFKRKHDQLPRPPAVIRRVEPDMVLG